MVDRHHNVGNETKREYAAGLPPTAWHHQQIAAWADTLSEVTAEAWRIPSGESVHPSVIGRFSDGATVRVYGGGPSPDSTPVSNWHPTSTSPFR